MMGSFLTRGLVMVFGYTYPAYECFKTVEKNKPEIEQLRFWCQYWIIVAMLTVFERVGDNFVSWLPMYSEAKLAFFVYLWYPRTKGTTYVYETFVRPFVAKHETEIDRNLLELRARAGDFAVLYWQKAASYGQTRIFEVLQYVASQSSRPRPAQRQPPPVQPHEPQQQQQPPPRSPRPAATSRQQAKQQSQQPPSRQAASTSQQAVPAQEAAPPTAPQPEAPKKQKPQPQRAVSDQTSAGTQEPSGQSAQPSQPSEAEEMETDTALASTDGNTAAPETIMEDAIRVTRGRLRKTRRQL